MSNDKQTKIDIPESIDRYEVTLFWGLSIRQVVLVFAATLLVGFSIYSLAAKNILTSVGMVTLAAACLLGIIEIRGRNFYRHLGFIVVYYKQKPRVLIYHHAPVSGLAREQAKQLVFEQEDNTKMFMLVIAGVAGGVLLLILTAIYLLHVIHP
jgi:hypothetical protein